MLYTPSWFAYKSSQVVPNLPFSRRRKLQPVNARKKHQIRLISKRAATILKQTINLLLVLSPSLYFSLSPNFRGFVGARVYKT